MPLLTIDELTGFGKTLHEIEVPELGGHVYGRPLSGITMSRIQRMMDDDNPDRVSNEIAACELIRETVCDTDGSLLFANSNGAVEGLAAPIYNTLVIACMRINGLSADAVTEKEKN